MGVCHCVPLPSQLLPSKATHRRRRRHEPTTGASCSTTTNPTGTDRRRLPWPAGTDDESETKLVLETAKMEAQQLPPVDKPKALSETIVCGVPVKMLVLVLLTVQVDLSPRRAHAVACNCGHLTYRQPPTATFHLPPSAHHLHLGYPRMPVRCS